MAKHEFLTISEQGCHCVIWYKGMVPWNWEFFYWFGAQLGSLTQNSIYPFTLISVIYQGLHCPFSLVKNKKCIYNIMFNNDNAFAVVI